MQNNNPHRTNDTDQLVDALLGFDHREFLQQMTDGLGPWHRRRHERRREARLYLASLALVAFMVPSAYRLSATDNYRLSGMTYEEAITETSTLLGL